MNPFNPGNPPAFTPNVAPAPAYAPPPQAQGYGPPPGFAPAPVASVPVPGYPPAGPALGSYAPYQAPPTQAPPPMPAQALDFGAMGSVDPTSNTPKFILGQHIAVFERAEAFRGNSGTYIFWHFKIEQSNSMAVGMSVSAMQNQAPPGNGSREMAARGNVQWTLPIIREADNKGLPWPQIMQELLTSNTYKGQPLAGRRVRVTVEPGNPKKAKIDPQTGQRKEPYPNFSVEAI